MFLLSRKSRFSLFLPPFKGSNTVQLLSSEGFLKYDIILQLCFPRISPHGGLFKGGLICKNDFLGGAYSRGAYSEVGTYSRIYGTDNSPGDSR